MGLKQIRMKGTSVVTCKTLDLYFCRRPLFLILQLVNILYLYFLLNLKCFSNGVVSFWGKLKHSENSSNRLYINSKNVLLLVLICL